MMSRKARKAPIIPLSEWEKYRVEITSLYAEQGETLSQVMEQMKEKHGFYATYANKAQFRRILKVWNDQKSRSISREYSNAFSDTLQTTPQNQLSHSDYTIGWICALPTEMSAAQAMLDFVHPALPQAHNDQNVYMLGEIAGHNVVIACPPYGVYGTTSVATVVVQMVSTFPEIRLGLLVGIGSGVPRDDVDIRLGDVVVSTPTGSSNGVIQYDFGKSIIYNQLQQASSLATPPTILLSAITSLRSQHRLQGDDIPKILSTLIEQHPESQKFKYPGQQYDRLFKAEYDSASTSDGLDDNQLVQRVSRHSLEPRVHYGTIASGNILIKDARTRDLLAQESNILCFEMEAVGLPHDFPCMVIKGICDYADTHKNSIWQGYAAATAAAFAKALLRHLPVEHSRPLAASSREVSSAYNNYLASVDLEQMLSKRAAEKMYSLNWQSSVVDLLKLLDLDTGITFRRDLARILDVDVGPDGSAVQDIALHHALMQEIAKNNGQVPMKLLHHQLELHEVASNSDGSDSDHRVSSMSFEDKTRTQLKQSRKEQTPSDVDVLLDSDAGETGEGHVLQTPTKKSSIESEPKNNLAPSEGDTSEISSLFSERTKNSSRSSTYGFEAADKELAYMFLTDAKMKYLFQCALAKVSLEKFTRNVKRLLVQYGRNLEEESREELHKSAAKYVQSSAPQVTIHIKRAMILEVRVDQLSKAKQVNDWLESFQERKDSPSRTLEAGSEDQESSSGTDEDEEEVDEDFSSQTLLKVQTFMTTAKAFETLQGEFQEWLTTGKRQSHRKRQQPRSHHTIHVQEQPCQTNLGDGECSPKCSHWGRDTFASILTIWNNIKEEIRFNIVPLVWAKPPSGYKRITWRSALGRPLYIDVKEITQGAAERLQGRLRSSVVPQSSSSSQPPSDTSVSLDPVATPPLAHLKADTNKSLSMDQRKNTSTRTEVSDRNQPLPSHERRYLLLCFSTHKSETFRQIDVTDLNNDQYLFSRIHDIYCEIKNKELWYLKIPFIKSLCLPTWMLGVLGDMRFYTPKEVNFVSFSLLPLRTIPSPVNIKFPSLPPEIEVKVHRNWHYHPCPREFEDLHISQTFVVQLLEPGHSFLDNTWLQLFPKKLHSELVYEPGKMIIAWGIQIVEGLNVVIIVWMLFLVSLVSGCLAVIYSACTRDVGGAFAIAAYLVASSTLLTVYFQLRR